MDPSAPIKGRRSLSTLIEEVRAPGASQVDVDSLLRGLSRPLGPDQDPRERADLLLSLLEDSRLADLTGSNDRTVRGAAVQALLALGYPYALEVPPEALAARDSAQQHATARNLLSTSKGKWGFGLIMAVAALLLVPALYAGVVTGSATALVLGLAFIAGTTVLPAILTMWGHNLGSGLIKGLGSLWLLVVGLLGLVPGVFALTGDTIVGLILIALAAALLTGTWLMNSKS